MVGIKKLSVTSALLLSVADQALAAPISSTSLALRSEAGADGSAAVSALERSESEDLDERDIEELDERDLDERSPMRAAGRGGAKPKLGSEMSSIISSLRRPGGRRVGWARDLEVDDLVVRDSEIDERDIDELDERDIEDLDERDIEELDERDIDELDERDFEELDERDIEELDERDLDERSPNRAAGRGGSKAKGSSLQKAVKRPSGGRGGSKSRGGSKPHSASKAHGGSRAHGGSKTHSASKVHGGTRAHGGSKTHAGSKNRGSSPHKSVKNGHSGSRSGSKHQGGQGSRAGGRKHSIVSKAKAAAARISKNRGRDVEADDLVVRDFEEVDERDIIEDVYARYFGATEDSEE